MPEHTLVAAYSLPPELAAVLPQVEAMCRQYRVLRLTLFGSRSRGDAGHHSDYDFLVDFGEYAPHANVPHLLDSYLAVKEHLEALLHQSVHLVPEGSVRNPYLLQTIAESRQHLFAA